MNWLFAYGSLLPAGATEFAGGDILLGGGGNDMLEGRRGDDLLDGDAWLNVQLRGVTTTGTVRLANSLQELRNDVLAGRMSPEVRLPLCEMSRESAARLEATLRKLTLL